MTRKRDAAVMLAAVIGAAVLSGCGGSTPAANSLPDGQYTGQSEADSDGSYGVVNFTVSSGAVTAASFVVYDQDGTPHDESYGLGSDGKPVDETFYQRAQNAIAAEKQYVAEFEESGDQEQVEQVAGASLSYRQFQAAVEDAIANASQ
ncbi:FMN-binding protein [Brooklawnia cerclae]|uniref:Major membrane immunogen (Membrane-anchored lipoprotein) n=1 Tax=Brooklawnia cerclae TaxID=349934 RepID=A0ABX0SLF4_9ACTN|nr:FMN-binding protein [Brooklawnia cerclae]NIH57870.1 major membrane immunogen (membrane-anchored lipoprotein) [Brooklawnia cerclae]